MYVVSLRDSEAWITKYFRVCFSMLQCDAHGRCLVWVLEFKVLA